MSDCGQTDDDDMRASHCDASYFIPTALVKRLLASLDLATGAVDQLDSLISSADVDRIGQSQPSPASQTLTVVVRASR